METNIAVRNCIKIDTDAIAEGIDRYIAKNDADPSFIVVNNDTFDLLSLENKSVVNCMPTYGYTTFMGVRVAICNALKFGEIEIV